MTGLGGKYWFNTHSDPMRWMVVPVQRLMIEPGQSLAEPVHKSVFLLLH